jgi:hypothetical protein
VPVWGANLTENYGSPITEAIPIELGTEYLLRVDNHESHRQLEWKGALPMGMRLVALDKNKVPIGELPGFPSEGMAESVGFNMALIRPGTWTGNNGVIRALDVEDGREDLARAAYLLLSATQAPAAQWPVRLQKFVTPRKSPGPGPEPLPKLTADFLAMVDLEARTWFVSNHLPRAAVGGPGGIKVYDTSVTPWRLLKHLDSKSLLGRESVFLFRDHELICMEWPCEGRPQAALRIIPLNSTMDYEAHERRLLPMNPLRSEVAVDESGVIFTAPSEGTFRTKFRALWLSADGKVLETSTERPAVEGPSEVMVAWWGKDGILGISEAGRMFHLKVTPTALTVEKQEPGNASFDAVPAGAEPSSHLWQPRFLLKDSNLLVRLDQKTGEVLTGYWLPYRCRGTAIWMSDVTSPVLLTTDQGELVRVVIPPLSH